MFSKQMSNHEQNLSQMLKLLGYIYKKKMKNWLDIEKCLWMGYIEHLCLQPYWYIGLLMLILLIQLARNKQIKWFSLFLVIGILDFAIKEAKQKASMGWCPLWLIDCVVDAQNKD